MSDQPSVDRRTVARLTLAFVAAYSVASPTGLGAQVQERDSLGVQIVETDGQQARAPSSVTVRSEPELQIGVLDGDPAYLFSGITGVGLLPGSRILVVDGRSRKRGSTISRADSSVEKEGSGTGPVSFGGRCFATRLQAIRW